jgi:hypothetical protein
LHGTRRIGGRTAGHAARFTAPVRRKRAVSEFIALLVSAMVLKKQWKENWNQGLGALEKDPALIEKLERVVLAQSRIWLLINPTEPTHRQLNEAMDAAMALLQSAQSDDAESTQSINTITTLARSILRTEWQRVKQGT